MAIITELFEINSKKFVKTYSDSNRYVVRDGVNYSEACDPFELSRMYVEGEEMPINKSDPEELLSILTGGAS